MAEPAPVRARPDGARPDGARPDGDREVPRPPARFDPLIHPVTITGHCIIGDQIRVPAVRCDMAGCEAAFADPAALGEADNRALAVVAGWAKDALGRLLCPACQRNYPTPVWWAFPREPRTIGNRDRADATARPGGGTNQSVWSAARRPPAASQGRRHHHRGTLWPRLLDALVSSR